MKRFLAATVIAAATLVLPAAAAHAADPPVPGGTCDGAIDVMCREPCTQELDCGLIPPCVLWVGWRCVIGG